MHSLARLSAGISLVLASASVLAEPPSGSLFFRFSSPATLSPLPETINAVESTDGTVFEYTFRPEVDLRGGITGTVDVRVTGSVEGAGNFNIPLSGPLSGKLKGRSGIGAIPASKVKLAFSLSGVLTLSDGVPRPYRLKGKFVGLITHADSAHSLSGKRVFKLDGARPDKARSSIAFDASVESDEWSLSLEVDADGAKLGGSAVLASGGRVLSDPYEIRGKYSEKTDASTLTLKAAPSSKGSSVKITRLRLFGNGSGDFEARYKLFGHKGAIPGSSAGANLLVGPESSEGTREEPLDISGQFPYRGRTAPDQPSYYRTTLVPGAQYVLSFGELDGEALSVDAYHDAGFEDRFCNTRTFHGAVPCPFTEDDDGELFIRVESGPFPTRYTLFLELIDLGGYSDEGTSEEPLALDVTELPRSGSVWRGDSFYRINGLSPGEPYTVTLSELEFDASDEAQTITMRLSGEGVDHAHADCGNWIDLGGGATSFDCAARAHPDGFLEIKVEGRFTAEGAGYTMSITPGGLTNEGFDDAPLDITDSLPWSGTTHHSGASQYLVHGLTPDASYRVELNGATQELQLQVWALNENRIRIERICRSSFDLETPDELCVVAPPTDAIVIWAASYSNAAPPGATFEIDVKPAE